jgi:tetratricopeptide (TPR) repeat protein
VTVKGAAHLGLAIALTACGSSRRPNVEQAAASDNACSGLEFPAELWTDDVRAKVRAGIIGATDDSALRAERSDRAERVLASLTRSATRWTDLRQQACASEHRSETELVQIDACLLANLAWRATIVEVAQSPPSGPATSFIEPNVLAMDLDAALCLYEANFMSYEPRSSTTALARDAIGKSRAHRWFEFHPRAQAAAQQAVDASSDGPPGLRAEALAELAWALEPTDPDAAERAAHEALREAKRANYELGAVSARHVLARIAYDRSDFETAIAIYHELLPEYARLLAADRPEYPGCVNDLALTYMAAGEFDRARTTMQDAVKHMEAVLGKDHLFTATSYDNFGYILDEQDDLQFALIYYERALRIRQRVLGSDHRDTATSLHDVGATLDALGNPEEARLFLEQALRSRLRVLGEDHIDTASTYFFLGLAQLNGQRLDESVQSFVHAEAIFSKVGAPIDAANAAEHIADIHYRQARYSDAIAASDRVIAIRKQELGANHPDTASALVDKAAALYAIRDICGSLACLREAQLAYFVEGEVRDQERLDYVRSAIEALRAEDPNC